MQKRSLGNTGIQVPVIVLGGNVFGWTVSEEDSFGLLDRAVDSGLNFIDTADVYSRWVPGHTGGESETIIGKWFARSGKRDQVILATKAGMDMGEGKQGLSPQYIRKAAEDSLRRLQTDRIDLYQSHQDDQNTPLEETLRAYDDLIREGKVRFIGASNYTGARLREALETSRRNHLPAYQTLQPLYNLVERTAYESDLAPVVADYGLGVIPYFALAAGYSATAALLLVPEKPSELYLSRMQEETAILRRDWLTRNAAVVIPTFNERHNIAGLVETLFDLYPDIHILVVDDHSPDGTVDVVRAL